MLLCGHVPYCEQVATVVDDGRVKLAAAQLDDRTGIAARGGGRCVVIGGGRAAGECRHLLSERAQPKSNQRSIVKHTRRVLRSAVRGNYTSLAADPPAAAAVHPCRLETARHRSAVPELPLRTATPARDHRPAPVCQPTLRIALCCQRTEPTGHYSPGVESAVVRHG
eukprot:COSAG01_NODE_31371_length_598_cov_118.062124_1_plen_166_part_10